MKLTKIQLLEMLELASRATPGDWIVDTEMYQWRRVQTKSGKDIYNPDKVICYQPRDGHAYGDLELIVAMRNSIVELVGEVLESRAVNTD